LSVVPPYPRRPRCTPSGPSRENRDREHQLPKERNRGAEKEGENRHFDACPQRRLHHRRILAFVPTNLPSRHIQGENTTLSLTPGAVEKGATKDSPPTESSTSSSPRAPTSLATTDKSRAELLARSSPWSLLCRRPSLHKHPSKSGPSLPLC
jgi:hypothetical protein